MRRYIMKLLNTGLLSVTLMLTHPATAVASVEVPMAENLQTDSVQCETRRLPILLMFSAEECPFCHTVEEEFLKPMMISGDYDDKVMIRKVMLDGHDDAVGFDGEPLDASLLAAQYNVFATPTLVFVDGQGNEIAEKLIGVNTVDYYGAYLDQSIDEAKQTLTKKGL